MMDFAPPVRKPMHENVVPMINVVFLLLIFFLMSAQIAPPDPVEITPPIATTHTPLPDAAQMAWLDAEGVLHVDGLRDVPALARLAEASGVVTLRADAQLPAAAFATVLRQLGEAGLHDVRLVAVSGAP